jgi:hypothetical protein
MLRAAPPTNRGRLTNPANVCGHGMLASGDYSVREVADELGFTARTIYRHLDKEHWSKAPTRKRPPRSAREDGVC